MTFEQLVDMLTGDIPEDIGTPIAEFAHFWAELDFEQFVESALSDR